jgi:lipid-A-disaccharide synthase
LRYFLSTGEASGELTATLLAQAIARIDPQADFEGIGAERMRAAGIKVWHDHTGWATMGLLAAIPRIPSLLVRMWQTAIHIARSRPDLVILIDFGAFNLRLATTLRRFFHYRGPILDVFPPGAWLDDSHTARKVAAHVVPLTAFAHQYEFYRSLGLPAMYFGHPLASRYELRATRPAPPADGGVVALLPGSRRDELRRHAPRLIEAFGILQRERPRLRGTFAASDARGEATLRAAIGRSDLSGVTIVRGVREAIADADAAWVASGTAVLECALLGVPAVALYVISPRAVRYARRVFPGPFITLPNLVLGRELVPELLQDDATAPRLAAAMEELLRDPSRQYVQFPELRSALGPPDALEACAKFAVALARAERAA